MRQALSRLQFWRDNGRSICRWWACSCHLTVLWAAPLLVASRKCAGHKHRRAAQWEATNFLRKPFLGASSSLALCWGMLRPDRGMLALLDAASPRGKLG